MHGKNIQVAFHKEALVFLRHLALSEPYSVQRLVLHIDGALLGVDVFGVWFPFLL